MRLDVRLPLGLMFAIIGVILIVYSFWAGSALPAHSPNFWTGIALLGFAGLCLGVAWRARRRLRSRPTPLSPSSPSPVKSP